MLIVSVKNIESLSIPRPNPAVGGREYSNAVQNASSYINASSSPAALS